MSVTTTKNKLSEDQIKTLNAQLNGTANKNKLWEEKVGNWGWALTVVPLINYALAVREDTTASNYNDKLAALVNAVAAQDVGSSDNATSQLRAEDVKDAEVEFYNAFKERCTKLGVTDKGISSYYTAAREGLRSASLEKTNSIFSISATQKLTVKKMREEVKSLDNRLLNDKIDGLVGLDAEKISPKKYKEVTKFVKKNSSDVELDQIDHDVRGRFGKRSEELNKLGDKYLALGNANKKIAGVQKELSRELKKSKGLLEVEMKKLRGKKDNQGNDTGTIHKAHTKIAPLKAKLDTAQTKLNAQTAKVEALVTQNGVKKKSKRNDKIKLQREEKLEKLHKLEARRDRAFDSHAKAVEKYEKLDARLKKIATFDNAGQVVGGKLGQVYANLNPANLGNCARAEANKRGDFYKELSKKTTLLSANPNEVSNNRAIAQASTDLRAIINS